jgi:hypothetical protein
MQQNRAFALVSTTLERLTKGAICRALAERVLGVELGV